jgi:hypothetical protein
MIAPTPLTQVVIRFSHHADEHALERLAGRDGKTLPAGPLLVAETSGEIRAALDLAGEAAAADPFHPTAGLVRLLEVRRAELRVEESRGRSEPRRLRRPVLALVGRLGRR